MGLFGGQFANVVEWQETRDDVIFYKWNNDEIKRGSRLIIRPGQDAIFLYNGKIEGIFQEEGNYDIESDIIPFLSTLKGFRFGFNSGLRAEVLFINTKEFTMRWGTKQAVNLPHPSLPGGMPVRANGMFQFKVSDYEKLIELINAKPTKDETDNERLIESYRYMGYYFLLKKDKANSVMYWNKILEIDRDNFLAIVEPGVITIRHDSASGWDSKQRNFRKSTQR